MNVETGIFVGWIALSSALFFLRGHKIGFCRPPKFYEVGLYTISCIGATILFILKAKGIL